MLPDRRYRKPPLIEVLCDFYFDLNEDDAWDPIRLSRFADGVRLRGYPHDTNIPGRGPAAPRGTKQRWGRRRRANWKWRHQFTSPDGNRTTQVGENLLVVNQSPPYYGWAKFKEEAIACLELYRSIWPVERIVHAGLHYVDIVDIHADAFFIDDYFNLFPVLPDDVDWSFNSVAMAFEVIGAQPGDVCSVAYHQRPSPSPTANSFQFRWDYISLDGIPALQPAISEWLDIAHDFVDRAFRSTMTEKCEQLFEPE